MSDDVLDMFDIEGQTEEAPEEATEGESTPEEGGEAPVEAVVEPTEPVEEPEGTTDTPEEVQTAPEAAEQAEKLLAGKYKTVEELEKAYTDGLADLQSTKNTEIDGLKSQMQQQQAQMQQFAAMQQQAAINDVSDEDIVKGLQVNPGNTMQWLMENQPSRTAEGVSAIRELHGNEIADQMLMEINSMQVQGTQQQVQAQYEAMQQPAVVQGNIQQAMGSLQEKYGEEFEELSDDVAKIIEDYEGIDFQNPAAIANALEVGFLHAWKAKATSAADKVSAPVASSPQQFVETGTPGQEPVVTPDEEILNDVVEQFQINQY